MTATYLPRECALFAGELYTEKDKHRIHKPLKDIVLAFLATYRGCEVAAGVFRAWPTDEWMSLGSLLFPGLIIGIPAHGVLEHALAGVQIEYVRLGLLYFPTNAVGESSDIFRTFYNSFVSAYFVQFADPWIEWIRRDVSTDYKNWPKISNFARVVRNAATHGGTINIQSATAPTVRWYTLSYDHSSYGRSIFGTDLSCADLILLMFEMCGELDKLGAPLAAS